MNQVYLIKSNKNNIFIQSDKQKILSEKSHFLFLQFVTYSNHWDKIATETYE